MRLHTHLRQSGPIPSDQLYTLREPFWFSGTYEICKLSCELFEASQFDETVWQLLIHMLAKGLSEPLRTATSPDGNTIFIKNTASQMPRAAVIDCLRQSLGKTKNPDPSPETPKEDGGPNVLVIFPGRLTIDKATKTITLDGDTFTISHAPTFNFYLRVAEARGELVDSATLTEIGGCKGRLDVLLKNHLKPVSEKLRETIKGRTGGGGYSVTLPPLGVQNEHAKKVRNRAQQ